MNRRTSGTRGRRPVLGDRDGLQLSTGVRNTKLKKGKLTEEEIALIRREHGITPEKLAQWEEETKRNRKKRRR